MRAWIAAVMVASVSVAVAAVDDDLREGDRYFEDGNWAKAAAAYDRAIEKAASQVSAGAYGKRAAIYIIVRDYAGGLAFVTRAKARQSALARAPELLEQEALLLWETGKKDEAIEVAETVVAARPRTFTNQKLLGEYFAARDPKRTVRAYGAYLVDRPADLESGDVVPRTRLGFALIALARLDLATGDTRAAESNYKQAVEQFAYLQRKFGKKPNVRINTDNGLCAAYTGLKQFDQAVTVCERVVSEPAQIDPTGAAWFNLGTAYLARKQTAKARTAATEFVKVRKGEARGVLLVGDTYFAERDWQRALEAYLRAEKLVRANEPRERTRVSIQLGKTYRRLSPQSSNLPLAIEKLDAAYASDAGNVELAIELGGAYLEARQDAKAEALAARFAGTSVPLLVIVGKAQYNQRHYAAARRTFEQALAAQPGTNVTIRRGLVFAINEQAFAESDPQRAQMFLEQAVPIDVESPVTTTNLAILALGRDDCDGARKHLEKLATLRGRDDVVRTRLLARTYTCGDQPDARKAAEAYAAAEREAKKANAQVALAEIYVEWAPLAWEQDADGAVDKLELAVAILERTEQASAAKRNLALALYRRGWKAMREGRALDAVGDFERAAKDPTLLVKTEGPAFEFSLALALVDAGRAAEGAKLFRSLAAKGTQATYLRGAYAKVGSQLFAAYASYRTGPLAARQQAAVDLARLGGEGLGGKLDELLASVWELIAYDQWRAGQAGAATKSLATAERYATGEIKRRLAFDKLALSLDRSALAQLEAMNGAPPEALVNLGILYDRAGRPKDAYTAWTRAKQRGAQSRDLAKWIDAKKRIYGY